jgi:ribosomal protein S18 acetylase RimI-like enzyme
MATPIIRRIDLADAAQTAALLALLDEYAAGPTGRGYGLDAEVRSRLPAVLAERPYYVGWLAFVDGEPAGVVNCFEGVSTFRAQPLLNIHDIAVSPRFQRRGVGRALLAAVEAEARARGCCKITLEVLEGNASAIAAYLKAGYEPYALDPAMGRAMFFERKFY